MAEKDTSKTALTRRTTARDERRLALIQATIGSIAEHGLTGTTIARVTEKAGVSMGLANFHFENKERLLEAVVQHLADLERKTWIQALADSADWPESQLAAMIDARFHPQLCTAENLAVWFAFWGDAGARVIYERLLAAVDDERLSVEIDLLSALSPRPPQDLRRIALGLEAFCDGLYLNLLLYPKDFSLAACRAMALSYLGAHLSPQVALYMSQAILEPAIPQPMDP